MEFNDLPQGQNGLYPYFLLTLVTELFDFDNLIFVSLLLIHCLFLPKVILVTGLILLFEFLYTFRLNLHIKRLTDMLFVCTVEALKSTLMSR